MKPGWKRTVAWITAFATVGAAGCATVPETRWAVPEVEGMEEAVACSGACEEEWRRAEEWVKKHSGYAFPAEVTVTPDRIEASRLPIRDCESIPQTRRGSLCPEMPLASEPLGFGDPSEPSARSRTPRRFLEGGPHWTFVVLRKAEDGGRSQIRLVQLCHAERGRGACEAPGIREHRQDRFRRFVRTGELLPR